MDDSYQLLFKVLIVGDVEVGKTSLKQRFLDPHAKIIDYKATLGTDLVSKLISMNDRKIKYQIWDTSGSERFRHEIKSNFKNAVGCILVYDISNRNSFGNLNTWINDIRSLAGNIPIILVGNKADLETIREVHKMEASQFSMSNKLASFFEASAKTGENVQEVFIKCAKSILLELDENRIDQVHVKGVLPQGKSGYQKLMEESEANKKCCWCC